jgi:predicted GTPase
MVVAKSDVAAAADVRQVMHNLRRINAHAAMVRAGSPVRLDDPAAVQGKRVLVIEDGPTSTHGGMAYGAGHVAATRAGAGQIVNPRPHAAPRIAAVYTAYPHLGAVLPAMGYSAPQLADLEQTINATPADVVVSATPIDLAALIAVNKPVVRARYEFAEMEDPGLTGIVDDYLQRCGLLAREE